MSLLPPKSSSTHPCEYFTVYTHFVHSGRPEKGVPRGGVSLRYPGPGAGGKEGNLPLRGRSLKPKMKLRISCVFRTGHGGLEREAQRISVVGEAGELGKCGACFSGNRVPYVTMRRYSKGLNHRRGEKPAIVCEHLGERAGSKRRRADRSFSNRCASGRR